jgi:hypothetical protein
MFLQPPNLGSSLILAVSTLYKLRIDILDIDYVRQALKHSILMQALSQNQTITTKMGLFRLPTPPSTSEMKNAFPALQQHLTLLIWSIIMQ